MKAKLTVKDAAKLLDCSIRHARRISKDGGLEFAINIGGFWYRPAEIPKHLTDELRFFMVSQGKRDEATMKAATVIELNSYLSLAKNKYRRKAAYREFASKKRVAERTLYRWRGQFVLHGLAGLVDRR